MKRLLLRLKQFTGQFWFIPSVMTVLAIVLAETGITLEERWGVPRGLEFVYSGGEAGSRSVLAAVASSAIGVAGTVFSITIAALSFAAGNMGPRLLDNFTRDRGNQLVLGIFIATFAFCLYTLRAVRGGEESPFVPHYNVTFALLLALACIAALVFFLAHVTGTITVTHVLNLLRNDLREALEAATEASEEPPVKTLALLPEDAFWEAGEALRAPESGYLQLLDTEKIVELAQKAGVTVRLYVRPGEYVFPNAVIARGVPRLPEGLLGTLTLGDTRERGQDLEYSVRQLAELAARALSPGINDPVTATDVIDRFGDALCRLRDRRWPSGTYWSGEGTALRLVVPVTDFGGLLDSMFHMIRQYGKGSPAVTARLLEVLGTVATCLEDPDRRAELRRHAELIWQDASEATENGSDRRDVERRYRACLAALVDRPEGRADA